MALLPTLGAQAARTVPGRSPRPAPSSLWGTFTASWFLTSRMLVTSVDSLSRDTHSSRGCTHPPIPISRQPWARGRAWVLSGKTRLRGEGGGARRVADSNPRPAPHVRTDASGIPASSSFKN